MTGILEFCREMARCTDVPGTITRTFLSPATRKAQQLVREYMEAAGLQVSVDAVGNLRGTTGTGPRVVIGSHIDTVPNAGAFDGVLGVALGVALAGARDGHVDIEVIAFSEEEGVRFQLPFIGSRAAAGTFDQELLQRTDAAGVTLDQAIRHFGFDPEEIPQAALGDEVLGYLEFHIEQGPVLESLDRELGIVEAIAGQTRMEVLFQGRANHAGTTPMELRQDALAAAAEWILAVEHEACATPGLIATVGRVDVSPGVANVIPGQVICSLDIRHTSDKQRRAAVQRLMAAANRRGLATEFTKRSEQKAVPMDIRWTAALEAAATRAGYRPQRMTSGAGHDAMILAQKFRTAMLFLRSPGGVSHHPDESVLESDVEAAFLTGIEFLKMVSVV